DRSEVLYRLFTELTQNADDLAAIMTSESGKALRESRGEVMYAAGYVRWYAEEAPRMYGDVVPENVAGRRILVSKEPLGVCGLITPWNFPLAMAARKLAPALAAGNTCVLKPAPETPLTALAMAELCARAGVPAGALSVVPAARGASAAAVGAALTGGADVRKISFTGSTAVGRLLMQQSAESGMKKLSLELGGNAPFL
ncbi:hypothetical protein HK405_002753, partial [Cladochytrium tenue]